MLAPGTTGTSEDINFSTRIFSSGTTTRASTNTCASAGTVLSVVPALATVGVTVVPSSALPNVEMRCTWCASSSRALIPFSGSNPACEARPVMRTSNVPVPLRAILSAPPSALGSSTNTAPVFPRPCARSSMSVRLVEEPTSSSEVQSISIPEVSTPALSRIAIA